LKGDRKTQSSIEVKEVYGPEEIDHLHYEKDIGLPGTNSFTRGSYPRMYREKLWMSGNSFATCAVTKK
jgi:methylmalonyl-CoA mutase N-terminal domain/subunit